VKIIEDIQTWRTIQDQLDSAFDIGFVPTMGALHKGHLSLVKQSMSENKITVVSIFINRAQFNNTDDYLNYPKTLENDIALLKTCNVDYCFLPTEEALYPEEQKIDFNIQHPLSKKFEGYIRPGHFEGVLTVVMKLFQIIQPDRAYFGEKDYQQYQLIKTMAQEFFLNTEIIGCPTIRESSGLPFSSRNARLTYQDKILAARATKIIHRTHASNLNEIKRILNTMNIEIDYLDVYNKRVLSAIKIGNIRLIDNFIPEKEAIC
jgi:pantoate--beta-alanine ligase